MCPADVAKSRDTVGRTIRGAVSLAAGRSRHKSLREVVPSLAGGDPGTDAPVASDEQESRTPQRLHGSPAAHVDQRIQFKTHR